MKTLHAIVAMPFGKKTGPDKTVIGFNVANKNKLLKSFVEPAFIQKSIFPGVQFLRERYFKLKPQAQIKAAQIDLDESLKDVNIYESCNPWLLYSALAYGIEKFQFVCLWNGQGGYVPGGSTYVYHEVNDKTGQLCWLNTGQLWVEKKG